MTNFKEFKLLFKVEGKGEEEEMLITEFDLYLNSIEHLLIPAK